MCKAMHLGILGVKVAGSIIIGTDLVYSVVHSVSN